MIPFSKIAVQHVKRLLRNLFIYLYLKLATSQAVRVSSLFENKNEKKNKDRHYDEKLLGRSLR
jgi:uncharacterized membrane protein